jgi:hypothetical protein
VGPRTGLDAEARGRILCLCRESNPGRPVPSQTVYFLSYPGSSNIVVVGLLIYLFLCFGLYSASVCYFIQSQLFEGRIFDRLQYQGKGGAYSVGSSRPNSGPQIESG